MYRASNDPQPEETTSKGTERFSFPDPNDVSYSGSATVGYDASISQDYLKNYKCKDETGPFESLQQFRYF